MGGTTDGVQLLLIQEVRSVLLTIAKKEESAGPYARIGNSSMKGLWKDMFEKQECVKWVDFFTVFPSKVPGLSADEIQVSARLQQPLALSPLSATIS